MRYTTGYSRLVKMHGSLDTENIVFKKSDYSDYSKNFQLIENYIKAIFSTDVVVLVGYSLGDTNVQQIIEWLKGNGKPIYFVKTKKDFNPSEFQEYQKWNIGVLYLNEKYPQKKPSQQIMKFFKCIQQKDEYKEKISPLLSDDEISTIQEMLINFDNKAMQDKIEKISQNDKITDDKELEKAFLLYYTQQYLQSYETLKRLSREAFRNKNHLVWYISEFNRKNFIFYYSPNISQEDQDKIDEYLKESQKNDLEENYLRLPTDIRQNVKPLTKLELELNKKLLEVYQLRDDIQKEQKNNTYYNANNLDSQNVNPISKLIEVLSKTEREMIIGLCVLYPYDEFYKNALKSLWNVLGEAFLRRDKHKEKGLKVEDMAMPRNFFSYSIRYFDTKELKEIFADFHQEKHYFVFENQQKLVTIFNNICSLFNCFGSLKSHYSRWFNNFLIVAAWIRLEQDIFDSIIPRFCNKLKENIISYNEYESLEYFIEYQYEKSEKINFETLIDIICAYIHNISVS